MSILIAVGLILYVSFVMYVSDEYQEKNPDDFYTKCLCKAFFTSFYHMFRYLCLGIKSIFNRKK